MFQIIILSIFILFIINQKVLIEYYKVITELATADMLQLNIEDLKTDSSLVLKKDSSLESLKQNLCDQELSQNLQNMELTTVLQTSFSIYLFSDCIKTFKCTDILTYTMHLHLSYTKVCAINICTFIEGIFKKYFFFF